MKKLTAVMILIFTAALLLFVSPPLARAGNWVSDKACNDFGCRDYKLWVPARYNGSTPVPLLMMLHGCTQNPDDIAAGTRWNVLAENHNFLVVYPDQPTSANSIKCWNWFLPDHQDRGAGEPSILAEVVNKVRSSYNVDASHTFVAGMSAGAALSVIMGATYPDLFRAIGVHSGLEYKAATDLLSATLAQRLGGPDPNQQGYVAYLAMRDAKRRMPVIVFNGDLDTTVTVTNAHQVITQWAQTNDYVDDGSDNNSVDDTADNTVDGMVPGGYTDTTYFYNDGSGGPLMEKWIVHGMRHAWSGGSSSGSFTDPLGPNATLEMCRFFGLCAYYLPFILRNQP